MRLLMTTDTVGGVWSFTNELTRQLLQRGHAVHLVSFGRRPTQDQHGQITGQAGLTYTATDIPLEWMPDNERAFESGQCVLLEQIAAFHPDLIISNQFCFGRLDTAVPRIVVAHSDVLSWARACRPSALEPTPWLNRYTSMVQGGLLDAAAVVTPTAWMGKALTTNFFLPRNYFVIPNGAAAQPVTEHEPERKLQAITAGRLWDEAKGLDTLKDLDSPLPLLVAGENSFDTAQGDKSWPAHLQNLGPLSQSALHAHFRQSAIYICTSRYEPFGLAPLEAALCGCALVARDLPSLREVWGDSAVYFNDNGSLTNALHAMARDPSLLAQAQARAGKRAAQFTPERMADAYLALLQAVLRQPQAMSHVA